MRELSNLINGLAKKLPLGPLFLREPALIVDGAIAEMLPTRGKTLIDKEFRQDPLDLTF